MNACPRKIVIALVVITILSSVVAAQDPAPLRSITYTLSMSRPTSHLFEVAMAIELPE